MKKALLALLISIAMLGANSISAQDKDELMPINIGIYGGLNLNMHTPSFTDTTLMINFNENKTLLGIHAGLIGNFPISEMFTFSGRLGFNSVGGEISGKRATAADSKLDATLYYFEIMPALQINNLIPVKNLYLLAGFEAGIPITAEYNLVTVPTSDNKSNQKISDASVRAALALGFGYVIPIGKSTYLTPEVSFRLPFTNVSTNANFDKWNIPQVRAGIALTFGLGGDDDTSGVSVPSSISAGFREVSYYDKDGTSKPVEKITLEEVQYTELFPLIPYIFFPENSPEPESKNQILSAGNEAGRFSLNTLEPDALKINVQTLDIIGTRLQQNPNSDIKIVGTLDGKAEAKNLDLSKSRADFAKDYLIVNYGITPDRITVEQRELPAKPSTLAVPEGVEENRRIEFSSSNQKITSPILVEKEKHTFSEPNPIQFVPFVESTDEITEWEFQIAQAGRIVKKESGKGQPTEIMWNILPNDLTASAIPVEYSIFAKNISGKTATKNGTLPIDFISSSRKKAEERPDKIISKFSLMLFDFDSPEVSAQDLELIEKHIAPAIKYNSTVQIFGYTDVIGDETYNKKLALKRAMSVLNILQEKSNTAKFEAYGVGESVQIFDNETPVGRQLSRTVQVYIITPKE